MKKYLFLLALISAFPVSAITWTGTVIGISDGDTVKVLNAEKQQIKIRLVEIDAPESKQAFGTQSKQSLSDICFKKTVVVDDRGTDKYKRTLGRVKCDGVDANAEQVKRGMAWAYRQYLTDQSIISLEETAKASKQGLWADENPTPPWEFRHGSKATKNQKQSTEKTVSINGLECGGKSLCGEMNNCAEANFYLNNCGLTRLDRDHDGVPCESICR